MISGDLRWKPVGAKVPRLGLASIDFDNGALIITEAEAKATPLYVIQGRKALAAHDPGAPEVLHAPLERFSEGAGDRNM